MDEIKKGIYEHYKGKRYRVLKITKQSETLEDLVVYEALRDNLEIRVRPLDMFIENVEVKGKKVPRFKFIE